MGALVDDPLTDLDDELRPVQQFHLFLRLASLMPDQVVEVVEGILIEGTLHKHQHQSLFLLLAVVGLVDPGCNGREGKSVNVRLEHLL